MYECISYLLCRFTFIAKALQLSCEGCPKPLLSNFVTETSVYLHNINIMARLQHYCNSCLISSHIDACCPVPYFKLEPTRLTLTLANQRLSVENQNMLLWTGAWGTAHRSCGTSAFLIFVKLNVYLFNKFIYISTYKCSSLIKKWVWVWWGLFLILYFL